MRATPHDVGRTTVVAVVVTRGSTAFLAETLDAVAAQTRPPDLVLVAAVDDVDLPVETGAQLVPSTVARTFGQAVRVALEHAEATDGWLWLLHDDSAPAPDALAALLRAVELAPSVAVAGCKQVDWYTPELLVEVGVSTSRFGRRMTGLDEAEVDQGQHDGREDVLAVGLAGALVRRDAWDELGGPDPVLGPYGDGLDLCRRARLAGHRVVVVPGAVVRHARGTLRGADVRPGWDARRAAQVRREAFLHQQLVGVPLPLVPVVALLALLSSVVRAAMRLVLKEPHLVVAELWAPWVVLARPRRVLRARRRAARTSTLRRSALRPLQHTTREVVRQFRDRRLAAAEARRTRTAPSELELRELAALRTRRRAGLVAVVLVTLGLTAVVVGSQVSAVLGGARLVGGTLPFGDADLGGLWSTVRSWWVETGLGSPAPPDPFLLVLVPPVAVLGSVGHAGAALVLGALVLSGVGAWFAAGAATRSVALRMWAALVWTAAPPLLTGLDQVRIGALLTHVALPWAVLGLASALGVARVDSVQSGLVDAQRVARGDDAQRVARDDDAQRVARDDDAQPVLRGDREAGTAVPEEPETANDDPALGPEPATAKHAVELVASVRPTRLSIAPTRPEPAPSPETTPSPEPAPIPGPETTLGAAAARDEGARRPAPAAPALPRTAEPSLAAAAGAGLALCLVTAGTPALLPAVLLAVLVVALVRPRRRLWWVVVPPLALHAPTLATVVADPERWRVLLAAPGLPVPVTGAPAWQQLLGWPSGPAGLPGVLPGDAAWVPGGVLVLLAVLALAVRPKAVRVVRLGWVAAALGLATAVAMSHVLVVPAGDVLTAPWSGGAVSLTVAGLLTAALVGAGRVSHRLSTARFGLRHVAVALLAVLAAGAPAALLGAWVVQSRSTPPALTATEQPVVPAAGTQLQSSPDAVRVLRLEAGDEVSATLLTGDGRQLTGTQRVPIADGVVGAPGQARQVSPDDADTELAQAAADLTVRTASASGELADLGVGAVLVPPAPGGGSAKRTRLVGVLDATAGLERVTETDAGILWRVSTEKRAVAWARLVQGTADQFGQVLGPVPADGRAVDIDVPSGPDGRLLVLAERADPAWRAWLDGAPLRAVETGWRQAFEVGSGRGHLVVRYQPAEQQPWQILQLIVLGATTLLAVPVRRRRSR
ncbi:glycosyltransferase [Isoptericola sp. b441]|uniref:Glycosyltransferase n=1 Tax=Actinotalea lenta TaxID=3064654 RepID=A0ABT9DCF9_9CELL|nr:glycosyltransferase [Isoptericola sp. b441]MDO8108571.1 glycosyltransferase [Isoptericola sp. b441]